MNPFDRDYIFHEATVGLCGQCLKTIPAKVIFKDAVYLLKNCQEHGIQQELFEEDIGYYLKKREYDKAGTAPVAQTKFSRGCPYDCGLCTEHDQHTCIGLIEVTNRCDQNCPVCFAQSGEGGFLDLEQIEAMMNYYQEAEHGTAEILQISGGEPTAHPDILRIIEMAKEKKFKFVMLNTNGVRITEDEAFVQELHRFTKGFEVYLQFDGFDSKTGRMLRGKDLTELKRRAVQNLAKYEVPVTLVATVGNGVNDHELGKIITFGIDSPWVRGVNFQPLGRFGRMDELPEHPEITVSGILRRIEKQMNGMIRLDDFIPLPCNVERIAITYLYKQKSGFVPITRQARIKEYLPVINNTFAFKVEDMLKDAGEGLFSWCNTCGCLKFLDDIRKFVPKNLKLLSPAERLRLINEHTFRISVNAFIDPYNFDLKSMQKECVHIITPDLKRIPFSAYNMLYRKEYEGYYR